MGLLVPIPWALPMAIAIRAFGPAVQSQRDCSVQPRVAAQRLPGVLGRRPSAPTLKGLHPPNVVCGTGATLSGLTWRGLEYPRVARRLATLGWTLQSRWDWGKKPNRNRAGGPDNLLSGCRRHKRHLTNRTQHRESYLCNARRGLLLLSNTDNKLSVPPEQRATYNSAKFLSIRNPSL